jgi:hypothetical protein
LGCDLNRSPWLRLQLENCSFLTFSQTCQEHDLAVWKFQRIVMGGDPVFVDLPKDRSSRLWRYFCVVLRTSATALSRISQQ